MAWYSLEESPSVPAVLLTLQLSETIGSGLFSA